MSARSFRSVFMVASCAGAALGCYLVSLRVASERAAVEQVESRIVLAQRDIRLLQTEIGTRGRLAQLERWNARVLALSAPSADQFLEGSFALARLVRPEPKPQLEAPVVLASAPADTRPPLRTEAAGPAGGTPVEALLHEASLKRSLGPDTRGVEIAERGRDPFAAAAASDRAAKKTGDNRTVADPSPVTATTRTAKVDPLAPLPGGSGPAKRKETGPTR